MITVTQLEKELNEYRDSTHDSPESWEKFYRAPVNVARLYLFAKYLKNALQFAIPIADCFLLFYGTNSDLKKLGIIGIAVIVALTAISGIINETQKILNNYSGYIENIKYLETDQFKKNYFVRGITDYLECSVINLGIHLLQLSALYFLLRQLEGIGKTQLHSYFWGILQTTPFALWGLLFILVSLFLSSSESLLSSIREQLGKHINSVIKEFNSSIKYNESKSRECKFPFLIFGFLSSFHYSLLTLGIIDCFRNSTTWGGICAACLGFLIMIFSFHFIGIVCHLTPNRSVGKKSFFLWGIWGTCPFIICYLSIQKLSFQYLTGFGISYIIQLLLILGLLFVEEQRKRVEQTILEKNGKVGAV